MFFEVAGFVCDPWDGLIDGNGAVGHAQGNRFRGLSGVGYAACDGGDQSRGKTQCKATTLF
jgi:hypothetical protein